MKRTFTAVPGKGIVANKVVGKHKARIYAATNIFKSKSEYFNFLNDEYGDDLDMAYGDMCGEVASEAFGEPLGVPEIFGKIPEDKLYARYISWRKRNGLYWPSAEEWWTVDYGAKFENMWNRYLAGPEAEVNKQFQIYPEPSIQGGSGSMVIFDESEDKNEPVYVDYQDWCDAETNMAAESENANDYATKYEIYLKSVIDWL